MGAHERALLHRPRHNAGAHIPGTSVSTEWQADTDVALVERARAGDQIAFEDLVRKYEHKIYTLAYRMMGNAEDAHDLTQECFIRAHNNLRRTRPDLNFSAWIHRIASNACIDALRRRKRLAWLPWEDSYGETQLHGAPPDNPELIVIANEERADVQRALNLMSDRHRLALLLREYQGLSTAEIGEVMGASRSAVKSMLFRSRNEFRDIYANEYGKQPVA